MKRTLSLVFLVAFLGAPLAPALTVKPNAAPVVSAALTDYQQYVQTTRVIDLNSFFRDPDATAAVNVNTVAGAMNFTLDGAAAPQTVANFLSYVNGGRYYQADPNAGGAIASLMFHRSVAGFVIQAGGFIATAASNGTDLVPTAVLTLAPVPNEPLISNTRGTIAMAKLGGDPNSATSQWFINLADNSANLDNQNGGFTAFGHVAAGGMAVADAIAAFPRFNFGGAFTDLPVRNYTQTDYNTGKNVKVANAITIPSITQISPLNFAASSNNPGAITATASGANLLVTAFTLGSATITVTATDLDGLSVSQSFVVTAIAAPARLRNIATRANFPTGSEVLAGGFIVRGGTSKKLVVRAISTSLGVANALPDPTLELLNAGGAVIASNNNWGDSPDRQQLIDLAIAPSGATESALIATVPSQDANITTYTARVRSANGAPGVASIEIYDIDSAPGSTFRNISTLGPVGTDANVLIGGFIVRGDDFRRVIIRGLGPSLSGRGVSGALTDPAIKVVNNQGTTVGMNDNWQTDPGAGEMQTIGLQPSDPREAAVIINVPSGEYTATVAGVSNTTGVGQVEVFVVQ